MRVSPEVLPFSKFENTKLAGRDRMNCTPIFGFGIQRVTNSTISPCLECWYSRGLKTLLVCVFNPLGFQHSLKVFHKKTGIDIIASHRIYDKKTAI